MRKKLLKLSGILLIAFGIWASVYGFSLSGWNVTFWKYMLLIGLAACGVGILHLKFIKEIKNKKIKRIIAVFHVFILVIIVSFFFVESLLMNYSHKKEADVPDYVVILGAGLNGSSPSQILNYRLNESLNLIKALPEDVKIIVSGGQGPGETITEAEAMKEFLLGKGIAFGRILKEDRSNNTLENLENTKELIRESDNRKAINITLVTSNFHMYRSRLLAERLGFNTVNCWSAPVHPFLTPVYYFREYAAVVKSMIFDWPPSPSSDSEVGQVIDEYKGVRVYNNGSRYTENHGKNFSSDGYYYGYKWQCVEYIKRFYYDVKGHKMPNGFGNAKDFFDKKLGQGEFNEARGLYQYKNEGNVKPQEDDIIVFNDTTYGHIGIVSDVGEDYIEIVQQNIYGKPRDRMPLNIKDGNYFVGDKRKPAGWLRKE
ncbi:MAG: ElyC/SanA/YdcF family protein [Bacillota bacterium]|nr:ElyC/SanA/YdcF family protein [Bacillota bacterium]